MMKPQTPADRASNPRIWICKALYHDKEAVNISEAML
jgi:hypothetical protein